MQNSARSGRQETELETCGNLARSIDLRELFPDGTSSKKSGYESIPVAFTDLFEEGAQIAMVLTSENVEHGRFAHPTRPLLPHGVDVDTTSLWFGVGLNDVRQTLEVLL